MTDGGRGKEPDAPSLAAGEQVAAAVREILSVIPAGCTWLVPVTVNGEVVDFRVAATSEHGPDIYGRGADRVDALLGELYPGMVGGPLWQAYQQVIATGVPVEVSDFRYREKRAGVIAESLFEVGVHRVLGGLLVWWQRLDENRRRLETTELLGNLGWAEHDLVTGESQWSPGMYRIFERDPALGPMSRAEQSALLLPDDAGLSEAAWQTMDSGGASDVTVRFRVGGSVKHLRVVSEVARDADGAPLKIYAVVQDVTAREDTRGAIERLSVQLRNREITALAEQRLAAQLQNMIQPVPRDPFPLPGLRAMVGYQPAERAARVGGDWYHAVALPDGTVTLAIGDVAGHGLGAASGMAYARFALIAWLSIGVRDPGTLLGHLNRLCGQLRITGTAVVAWYDPQTRVLTWGRAGHMAPLLARAGIADPLDRPPGLLLGADDSARYPVVTARLKPGDLVVFYTDGLVERRASGTAPRLEQVRRALAAASAGPAERALAALRAPLHRANPDDDTCTLVIHVEPGATS